MTESTQLAYNQDPGYCGVLAVCVLVLHFILNVILLTVYTWMPPHEYSIVYNRAKYLGGAGAVIIFTLHALLVMQLSTGQCCDHNHC